MQAVVKDLEKRKAALEKALGNAVMNEKLRQEAEKRVSELEESIRRVKERSRQMLQHVQMQRCVSV